MLSFTLHSILSVPIRSFPFNFNSFHSQTLYLYQIPLLCKDQKKKKQDQHSQCKPPKQSKHTHARTHTKQKQKETEMVVPDDGLEPPPSGWEPDALPNCANQANHTPPNLYFDCPHKQPTWQWTPINRFPQRRSMCRSTMDYRSTSRLCAVDEGVHLLFFKKS